MIKSKILSLFLFTVLLSIMVVSAVDFSVSKSSINFVKPVDSATFTINSAEWNETVSSSYTIVTPTDILNDDDEAITITASPSVLTEINDTTIITLNSTIDYSKLTLGKLYTGDLMIIDSDDNSINKTIELSFGSAYCENGFQNEDLLEIDVEIDNANGFGEEDTEWYPLDEIEIDINVENMHDDTIDDITVEWCLYSVDEDDCVIEDKEADFKLKEDKDKDILISFQVDPNDLDKDANDYILFVKVYSDHKDYGEENLCTEYSEPIDIILDDHFVVLSDAEITEQVACEDYIDFSADIWNIGQEDEAEIYVMVYNKELDINEKIDVGDIDTLEDKLLTFDYLIPKGTEEGTYFLEFIIFDEDDDIFENDNDDEAKFRYSFVVEGNCVIKKSAVRITAELDDETPEAIAGKSVIIKATLINIGDEEATYTVSVSGNSGWSNVDKIDPPSVTLDAGESKDVSIILQLDNDAEGEKEFTIRADYAEGFEEQAVALEISSEEIKYEAVAQHIRDNWFIYVIVIINIILIIAIIAVIRRMSSPAVSAM